MTALDWTMILAYFALLAGVVVFTMRRKRIETEKDLFLGGRSVGWLAIGASIFAANIGSEHLIGLAGSGAVAGLSQSHWEFHAWVIVMMSWVFLPFYYNSGVSTMPEFLERRFGPKARWILSLVSLAAYVLTKISVTVYAGALFFEVPYDWRHGGKLVLDRRGADRRPRGRVLVHRRTLCCCLHRPCADVHHPRRYVVRDGLCALPPR